MSEIIVIAEEPDKTASTDLYEWQRKLMRWMVVMPSVMVAVFVILATVQLNRFNQEISKGQDSSIDSVFYPINNANNSVADASRLEYLKWYTLAKMEEVAMQKRYNQGGILLMSRVFTKYLGFFTGMILAIVGAVFIISKLKEDVSKLGGSLNKDMKILIVSSSPGVIFGILGTILMLATILHHAEINVKDMPMYLNQATILSTNGYAVPFRNNISADNLDSLDNDSAKQAYKKYWDSVMQHSKPTN